MEEIIIKLEVPQGLEDKIKVVIERVVKEIIEEIEFSLAKEILEGSELTEEQARDLGKEVNTAVAKKHS